MQLCNFRPLAEILLSFEISHRFHFDRNAIASRYQQEPERDLRFMSDCYMVSGDARIRARP